MPSASKDKIEQLRQAYVRDGYVVIDDLFPQADLEHLRSIADEVTQDARTGKWPHIRRVGKQFPPFDAVDELDCWGVQHLMHPEMAHTDDFRRFYSQESFVQIAAGLMHCSPEEVQMELFNLLVNPEKHHFALAWHRDDVRPDVSNDEEMIRLAQPAYGVQWNAALYDDDCLFIVPGTHTRTRTEPERIANAKPPPPPVAVKRAATGGGGHDVQSSIAGDQTSSSINGDWSIDPPSTLRLTLKAGQTVFYSQRILHRASYLPTKKRATLHGCYGQAHPDAHGERARMILQHGVDYMKDESFGDSLPERLRPMWRLLMSEYSSRPTQNHGYSLCG